MYKGLTRNVLQSQGVSLTENGNGQKLVKKDTQSRLQEIEFAEPFSLKISTIGPCGKLYWVKNVSLNQFSTF